MRSTRRRQLKVISVPLRRTETSLSTAAQRRPLQTAQDVEQNHHAGSVQLRSLLETQPSNTEHFISSIIQSDSDARARGSQTEVQGPIRGRQVEAGRKNKLLYIWYFDFLDVRLLPVCVGVGGVFGNQRSKETVSREINRKNIKKTFRFILFSVLWRAGSTVTVQNNFKKTQSHT